MNQSRIFNRIENWGYPPAILKLDTFRNLKFLWEKYEFVTLKLLSFKYVPDAFLGIRVIFKWCFLLQNIFDDIRCLCYFEMLFKSPTRNIQIKISLSLDLSSYSSCTQPLVEIRNFWVLVGASKCASWGTCQFWDVQVWRCVY